MAKPRTDPALDKRPLVMSDMKPAGRKAARAIVQDYAAALPDEMAAQGAGKRRQAANARAKGGTSAKNASTYDAAAKRMEESAPKIAGMRRRPGTTHGMASNNVDAVELAATTHRTPAATHPQNGREMPQESLGGAGWYLHAGGAIRSEAPASMPIDRAVVASSTLSVGTKPEDERASMGAAAHAITSGAGVKMTPKVRAHLAANGLSTPSALGTVVPYHELTGAHASALADPEIREHMEQHSPGVDWRGLGRAANGENRAKAHDILRGATPTEEAQSPFSAPKTSTYSHNLQLGAVTASDHHDVASEYLARGAHLGDLIRGDVPKGQQMLDLWGKRNSTEGILSPKLSTPQDSWQMGIHNVGVSEPSVIKVAGDMAPGAKTHSGVSAHPDPRVGAPSVVHAVHDEATQRAAEMLTRKYDPGYPVASQLVQETGWTGARRLAGGDKDYNGAVRVQTQAAKQPRPSATSSVQFDGIPQRATQEKLSPQPAPVKVEDQVWTHGDQARHEATVAKRRRNSPRPELPADPNARSSGW